LPAAALVFVPSFGAAAPAPAWLLDEAAAWVPSWVDVGCVSAGLEQAHPSTRSAQVTGAEKERT
jgi:hypothetical protein